MLSNALVRQRILQSCHRPTIRSLVSKKKQQAESEPPTVSYFERKKAAKAARVLTYQQRLAKAQQVKHRRDDAPKDVLKNQFRSWWDARKAREEKMDRLARQQGKEWKIRVAVLLERLPQILPDRTDWEKDFDELKTYLSQFGKEYPKEFEGSALTTGQIPISDEELLELLPEGFEPAPRETKADETGDTSTLERKLKDRVYLLKDGEFPSTEVGEDESLLEAAQRATNEAVGKSIDLYCPSQAPVAVTLSEEGVTDQLFGTKTFYMKVQLDYEVGTVSVKNVQWLNRDEVVEQLDASEEDGRSFYRYVL